MWLLQFKCLLIVIPRKLKLSINSMTDPAIWSSGSWITFWCMWKAIAFVLFTFSDSLLDLSQLWKLFNSSFNELLIRSLVISVVSSEKLKNLNISLDRAMSFMYMIWHLICTTGRNQIFGQNIDFRFLTVYDAIIPNLHVHVAINSLCVLYYINKDIWVWVVFNFAEVLSRKLVDGVGFISIFL